MRSDRLEGQPCPDFFVRLSGERYNLGLDLEL
jgi:hypothetical protein